MIHPTVPPPPENCQFTNVGYNSLEVTWDKPNTPCQVSTYNVSWFQDNDEPYSDEISTDKTQVTLTDLYPDSDITVNIIAATEEGFGDPTTCYSHTNQYGAYFIVVYHE